ncbi:MAG: hypothetical protein ACE5JM_03995 [Armatimonadota bacterium]
MSRTHGRWASVSWIAACASLALTGPVLATPSGLNNIPTSDVVSEGVLVLQQFTNFGDTQAVVSTVGFKYGPVRNVEIGVDDNLGIARSGLAGNGVAGAGGAPASISVFQAKYRLLDRPGGWAGAVGVANLSDASEAGAAVQYLALSKPVGKARLHGGYLVQGGTDALFAGLDGPLTDRTTGRVDLIQTDDGREVLTSVGFISELASRFLVEGWVSFPSESGPNNTFTLKFNYVPIRGH